MIGQVSTTSARELILIRPILPFLLLVTLAAEADLPTPSPVAGHQPGEEAAVLAVVDQYLAAISAQDHAAMAALHMPDGMTYRARPAEGGGIEVVGRPNAYWCGVDTFDFVKVEGRWRVANMMRTVEPDAYADLRPAGAVMRRNDGRW